ncbi:hypothetical protein NL676_035152 [Syzygium grande]|nr:hypothetical protein NL676_035152 [Syzygium grande]
MLGDGHSVKEGPAGVALGGDSVRGVGIVATRFRAIKNAWKIERTSFVERRNYFTSVNENLQMKVLVILPNMGSFLSSFFVEYFYFRLSSATQTFTETP